MLPNLVLTVCYGGNEGYRATPEGCAGPTRLQVCDEAGCEISRDEASKLALGDAHPLGPEGEKTRNTRNNSNTRLEKSVSGRVAVCVEQACHEVSQLGTHKAGPAQKWKTCISIFFLQGFQGSGRAQIPEYMQLCPSSFAWVIGRTIFP